MNVPIKGYYLIPQAMITITEDALKLRVKEAAERDRLKSELTAKFVGSFSMFLGLLLSFVGTSQFRSFLVSADVWQAFFLFCIAASGSLSIYFLIKLKRVPEPIDIVGQIVKESKDIQDLSGKAEGITLLPQPDWLITPPPKV